MIDTKKITLFGLSLSCFMFTIGLPSELKILPLAITYVLSHIGFWTCNIIDFTIDIIRVSDFLMIDSNDFLYSWYRIADAIIPVTAEMHYFPISVPIILMIVPPIIYRLIFAPILASKIIKPTINKYLGVVIK